MARNYYQGKYIVENSQKYEGNEKDVTFRSSWEYKAFHYCDTNHKVKRWSSEEVIIPYISPVDGRVHRYFMDLKIVTVDPDTGREVVTLVEIKPEKETLPPTKQGKKTERYKEEVKTYLVNRAKWAAATNFCKKRGWLFTIWTEKNLIPDSSPCIKELKAKTNYEQKMKKAFKRKKKPAQLAAIKKTKQLIQERKG